MLIFRKDQISLQRQKIQAIILLFLIKLLIMRILILINVKSGDEIEIYNEYLET